jgi:hypothetical protein
MAANLNSESTRIILAALSDCLHPYGFGRRGQQFERAIADVLHLVQLQKSTTSTAAHIRVTVNLAVWTAVLSETYAKRPSVVDAPWQERIGFVMPGHHDVWWTASTKAEAFQAGEQIVAAIRDYGIPALNAISSTQDLRRYWENGGWGGLTERQRDALLTRLRAAQGFQDDGDKKQATK